MSSSLLRQFIMEVLSSPFKEGDKVRSTNGTEGTVVDASDDVVVQWDGRGGDMSEDVYTKSEASGELAVISNVREVQDFRVPNQLMSKKSSSKKSDADKETEKKSDSEEEMDEASGAGAIAGFTGPLGASNLDMGHDHAVAGKPVKKRKKTFVRWK